MRVIQLSDLHLGPEDHHEPRRREHNAVAWTHARRTARWLGDQPDAASLVVVITGDLTDAGHENPEEFGPAVEWLTALRATVGRVLIVPGNHDTGNFVTAPQATPTIERRYVDQWATQVGPDRFVHAADGHRLLGLHSQLWSSGLPEEAHQLAWLREQLDAAAAAAETVHVFQHAPLYLHSPDEVRGDVGTYWCPGSAARDRVWAELDRPHVQTLASGHVHRRRDQVGGEGGGDGDGDENKIQVVWCPALSGTHSDAGYFPRDPQAGTHALPTWTLVPGRTRFAWTETRQPQRTRQVR